MNITIITLATAVSLANVPAMPDSYTLLCEGQQSIGFNWRAGKWVETRYSPSRYIVAKIESNNCRIIYNGKFQSIPNNGVMQNFGPLYQKSVCLNVRNVEDEYSPFLSQPCQETYFLENGKWNKSFACDRAMTSFAGSFDGEFHRASNHTNTAARPENDYKDSLAMEVGKCTKIS
ncbi:MAG: hypothetical protein WA940_01355 [Sphingopyxis sp.]